MKIYHFALFICREGIWIASKENGQGCRNKEIQHIRPPRMDQTQHQTVLCNLHEGNKTKNKLQNLSEVSSQTRRS